MATIDTSGVTAMSAQLQNFFKACDPEGTRSVDREAFRDLCSRLNIATEDADVIFEDLDHDRDDRISFADFSKGFSNFMNDSSAFRQTQVAAEEVTKHHVWTTLTSEAERVGKKSSDEGKLKWLLNELQMSEQRHLVPFLESAVEELIGNLHTLQEEKGRLEESWHREKLEHEKHLKRMEEELDHQVKEAELKLRLKAQEQVEDERKSLQSRMDSELEKLQSHLALMEKVYSWLRTQPTDNVRLDEVRTKLDEAVRDNRQLRMSLLDTQTSIALMRSELLQLRTMYEEKCRELSSERERILEVLQEQDQLSRQLNLLHDANKRLLDSHDVLRSTVENSTKQGVLHRCKSGSIIGDYLDTGLSSHDFLGRFQEEDYEDDDCSENRRPKSMDCSYAVIRRPKAKERQLACRSLNHSDSGVSSTVRDSGEVDENWDASPRPGEDSDDEEDPFNTRQLRPKRESGQSSSRPSSMPSPASETLCKGDSQRNRNFEIKDMKSSNSQDSVLNIDTMPRRKISEIKKQLGIEDTPTREKFLNSLNKSWSPKPVQASTPKGRPLPPEPTNFPPVPMPRTSKISSIYETIDRDDDDDISEAGFSELNTYSVELDHHYEPTGPAEHTFKVIFVGDAGVGKSSFTLRISKGVFVKHMSSTLGLDFLMRTMRVDGKNVTVQLWDTAGQERFRSITKTYFRKADGVMLLYDCTCEHSFLNVRQWVEDIDVSCFYSMMAENPSPNRKSSPQRIPLMIVANKIDLREVALKTGTTCITREQGEKLAKDCDTTFMEASAKDGSNVLHALANLIRSMTTQQDLQLSASTMQLSEARTKKSGCCGK